MNHENTCQRCQAPLGELHTEARQQGLCPDCWHYQQTVTGMNRAACDRYIEALRRGAYQGG